MIRLLLVDDQPAVRRGLGMRLHLEPDIQIVGEASTGKEALSMAQVLAPDVVLMDVEMPEMNGIEATAVLSASLSTSAVVILSIHDVPRLQSLLAYLALHRGVPQSRSRIAYTLWPDSTDAQAHTNLRNLLFKLRMTLPEVDTFLVVDRLTLCWQQDTFWSLDVIDFEGAIARAEQARCTQNTAEERQALEEAVKLYQGDLLPSCYDEWIQPERDRLQQTYQGALERLTELLQQERNYAGAIRVAQLLLRLDPLQEATYRHLMRLYAVRGDRGAILRTYQTCAAVLKRELAIEPGLTTRNTYERLIRAEN